MSKSKAITPEGARVEELMKILGLKAPAMSSKLGFKTPITIYNIIKGKQGISRRFVEAVEMAFPGVNSDWVRTGNGKALGKSTTRLTESPAHQGSSVERGSTSKIPAINLVAKSDPRSALADYMNTRATGTFQMPGFKDCDVAVRMVGEHFYPEIKSGDTVLLKEVDAAKATLAGERYIMVTKDRIIQKHMSRSDDGKQIIAFDEEGIVEDVTINKGDVEKLFMVKGYVARIEL